MIKIQDEDKLEVLELLASKELSFAEAAKRIDEIKSWKHTRDTFLREVNISTWEEAQHRFPRYAKKDALTRFKLKNEKKLPQEFKVCDY